MQTKSSRLCALLVNLQCMSVKEDKYFYSKSTEKYSFSRSSHDVIRWNQFYSVEVDEDVDYHQFISFRFDKLKTGEIEKPKSSEYQNVRSIIKEVFLSHYNLAMNNIYDVAIDEGEFYLRKNSTSWFDIVYFSKDEKAKQSIEINFQDSIEEIYLTITCNPGYKGRPVYRKKGTAITKERFEQFLNCTLQLLNDSDSYTIFIDDYLRKFYQLLEVNNKIDGFIISAEKSFEKILDQLSLRKENLEKRLIESDTDSAIDRAKLRGEVEGLIYAIKTISTTV